MLLVEDSQTAERAQAALSDALESGKLAEARIEQALKRIRLVKRGLRPPGDKLARGSLASLAKQFSAFSAACTDSEDLD
jgi:hypothetical protein